MLKSSILRLSLKKIQDVYKRQAQYRDTLLGIYGRGGKEYEIEQYLKSHDTVKIATTFDSLRKVADTLARYGFDAYKDAHLLVDE